MHSDWKLRSEGPLGSMCSIHSESTWEPVMRNESLEDCLLTITGGKGPCQQGGLSLSPRQKSASKAGVWCRKREADLEVGKQGKACWMFLGLFSASYVPSICFQSVPRVLTHWVISNNLHDAAGNCALNVERCAGLLLCTFHVPKVTWCSPDCLALSTLRHFAHFSKC